MAPCIKQSFQSSLSKRLAPVLNSRIHLTVLPLSKSCTSPPSRSNLRLLAPSPSSSPLPSARRHFSMSDTMKRNPHPDFKKIEASRPEWDASSTFRYTKTPAPDWKLGGGANATAAPAADKHVTIDPYEDGRPVGFNYKLLISGVIPRPIAFVSTRSPDGQATNLAPFSYFNMVGHDPPLFVVGFAPGGPNGKDTLRNLRESGECVINIISEGFIEAANSASVDAPYGSSEWSVSGLTPVYDCQTVKCARVGEAVFSVEAKLDTINEYKSRSKPGQVSSTVVVVEGTRFWVREDAINEEKNLIDPAVRAPLHL